MDVIADIGDWLASERLDSAHAGDAKLGLLAVLANMLQLQPTVETPPSSLLAELQVAREGIPQQLAYVEPDDPFGVWLSIAAVAELSGQNALAQLVLDELRFKIGRAGPGNPADFVTRERLAVCWSRRGRLSRIAGHHDDAHECYHEAIRLVRRLPWRDARPLAELGLCALAASKGNYPAVVRRARRILGYRPFVVEVHRVAAHQMMALARRKTGKLLEAMLHAWEAYDLVPDGDVRGIELVLSLAEIAIGLGDLEAAEHGFATVLSSVVSRRLEVSALVGAVGVHSYRYAHNINEVEPTRLEDNLRRLHTLSLEDLPPRDAVRVLIALVDGEMIRGNEDRMIERLQEASTLAKRFGLYEQQFRVDDLAQQLERRTERSRSLATWGAPANVVPSSASSPRHPALSRLISVSLA